MNDETKQMVVAILIAIVGLIAFVFTVIKINDERLIAYMIYPLFLGILGLLLVGIPYLTLRKPKSMSNDKVKQQG